MSWPPGSVDDLLAVLGLERERVLAAAESADGYGKHLAEDADTLLSAATMKVLAGGCWLLVGARHAAPAFAAATTSFARLGKPFALVTSICAGTVQSPWPGGRHEPAGPGSTELAYRGLWAAWLLVSGAGDRVPSGSLDRLLGALRRESPRRVGHLAVPLDRYLAFFRIAQRHATGGVGDEAFADVLGRLLNRAGEAVRVAMADPYHWSRLQSGLMPVEPELLAIGRVAYRMLPPDWDWATLPSGVDQAPLWLARRMERPDGEPRGRSRRPRPRVPGPAPTRPAR